jgi:hypothetical protein
MRTKDKGVSNLEREEEDEDSRDSVNVRQGVLCIVMNIKAFTMAMYIRSVAHDEHRMIVYFTTWIMNDELLNQVIVLSNDPYYYVLSVKAGLSPLSPFRFRSLFIHNQRQLSGIKRKYQHPSKITNPSITGATREYLDAVQECLHGGRRRRR